MVATLFPLSPQKLWRSQVVRAIRALEGDSMIGQAERVVLGTYGDRVSVAEKAKNLNKFGRRDDIGSAEFSTVAEIPVSNETYEATNAITSIVSTSAADTQTLTLEGHTVDLVGNLTFRTQDVTLNGQTPVALATPLARANRLVIAASGTFGSPQPEAAGIISVYNGTDGATAGVPTTDAAVKLTIQPGGTQTQKAATSISANDYWFVSYFSAAIGEAGKTAEYVVVRVEAQDVANGGVWRPLGRNIILSTAQPGRLLQFNPYLIVPANHDIRVRATTDANIASVDAEVGGFLAVKV